MQNKKIILLVAFFIISFILVYLFLGKEKIGIDIKKDKKEQEQSLAKKTKDDYAELQLQFALDLPCGVTDFESPLVKPVQCSEDKMKKGDEIELRLTGNIVKEGSGSNIEGVKITVNGGEPFYTDINGYFDSKIKVDSVKKAINLVADKSGYSPIRKVFNAQVPNADWTDFEIPETRNVEFLIMREIEIKKVNLGSADITITSEKYPGVSVTIPAGGLENSKGEVVLGEVTGEITYLDPNKPEDFVLAPGVEGVANKLVGVNMKGEQGSLTSNGMILFHFKKEGSDEILQPRKGTIVTITQPMLEEDYQKMTDPELVKAGMLSEEDEREFHKKMGIEEGMSEEEIFKKMLERGANTGANFWYFNQRTGLWEEWPIASMDNDLERKVYIMKVPAFY
ncbi:MAG: hypothetical protein ACWGHO_03930 [Candidatus Moraniibacteriota bacterium]